MAKILLVEDDQNLSEIYNARLSAEGYEVVSSANGEDALAVASQEKPDLVISDVMMPRVSGFEMLDILKHTDGMQGVKVIMLTALGQDNDRSKASELGADRYLVKSQVTLEDIVTTAKELLGDGEAEPDLNLQAVPGNASTNAFAANNQPNDQTTVPAPQPVQNTAASTNDSGLAPAPEFQASTPSTVETVDPPVTSVNPQPATPESTIPVTPAQQPVSPVYSQPETQTAFQAAPNTSESAPQPAANELLDAAEPIAQEEAELSAQLSNASVVEDLGDSPQPDNSSPVAAAGQAVGVDSPVAPQQVASITSQPSEVGQVGQSQAPVAPAPETPQSVDSMPAPAREPASTTDQPVDNNQTVTNHDELLASALKELESNDPNQPLAASQPATDNPAAPVTTPTDNEQKTERKVILPPDQSNARPDINDLLNKEESQSSSAAPTQANSLNQVISPSTDTPGYESQSQGGIDPSSISL